MLALNIPHWPWKVHAGPQHLQCLENLRIYWSWVSKAFITWVLGEEVLDSWGLGLPLSLLNLTLGHEEHRISLVLGLMAIAFASPGLQNSDFNGPGFQDLCTSWSSASGRLKQQLQQADFHI